MIIVKIIRDIGTHFPARRSEWVLAGMMMGWGLLVLSPAVDLTPQSSWVFLLNWASEPVWGWGALLVGAFRWIALTINGTFHRTWYGRYSPHVRAVASFLCCFIWTQLTWGLLNAGSLNTGLAVYPGLLLLDIMNVVAAASDAGKVDKARLDECK